MTHRGRHGFTVLETMLIGSLTAVVMLVLVQSLTPCLRIWLLTQTVSEARTKGILTLQKILTELRASTSPSVTSGSNACSFLAVGQEGGYNPVNGAPIWRQVVVFYVHCGNLYRRTYQPGDTPLLPHTLPTSTPFALSGPELTNLQNNGKRICTDVSLFALESRGANLWKLTLDTEAQSQRGKVTCRRQSDLALRNAQ